jgi:hypothetical protein
MFSAVMTHAYGASSASIAAFETAANPVDNGPV